MSSNRHTARITAAIRKPAPNEPFSFLLPVLLFKKKFLPAIRSGKKTQTIRMWTHRRMKPGQRSYIPGAGYIRIESVDQIELTSLTDEDAQRDGFDTAEGLRAEIEALYTDCPVKSRHAYRVCFAVLPPKEQMKLKKQREKKRRETRGE